MDQSADALIFLHYTQLNFVETDGNTLQSRHNGLITVTH